MESEKKTLTKDDRVNQYFDVADTIMGQEPATALMVWLNYKGFFTAPASTKFHGAYEGGLFDHSMEVYRQLQWMTDVNHLKWENPRSPFVIGLLHDVCKMDQYKPIPYAPGEEDVTGNGIKGYEFVTNTLLTGHGEKSLMVLLTAPIRLTMEEIACIRYHMGAFTEKEQWNDYTNAIHQYPVVCWCHHADMLASHVEGV